jgi:mono/diheme cytochrome c family protein
MNRLRYAVLTLGISAGLGLLGGAFFIFGGVYNVGAVDQHSAITNWVLHTVALHSIERRARHIGAPNLADAAKVNRGLGLYRQNCLQCHGAPGEAPASYSMGLTPGAPPMMQVAREWSANEIYWVIKNGIKMTAMPAWRYRMSDGELWDIVAFVETMPGLSPAEYRDRVAAYVGAPKAEPASAASGADAQRGREALEQYACASCHVIPGVAAPPGHVGPTLAGVNERSILAGLSANTPDGMIAWIRHPQQIKPSTAMPDMGVTMDDARNMVAYLATLR